MAANPTTGLSRTFLLCFLLLSGVLSATGGQTAVKSMTRLPRGLHSTDIIPTWNYLLHLPSGYSRSGQPWPMIFYLHGRSIRGNDINALKRYGIPAFLDRTPEFPFVVVSPLLPEKSWPAESLLDLLDEITRKYNVDRDRIYLTGVSMGADGAWYLAAGDQKRFAAMAPLCGFGDASLVPRVTEIPIWAFHGDSDKVVALGPHQRLIEAIQKAGGDARLTVIPEGTHGNIIFPTYQRKDLYDWFLSHIRGQPTSEKFETEPVPGGGEKLPPKKGHVVQEGETLWGISHAHHITVAQLKEANGLISNTIRVGQLLEIPNL